MKKILLLMLCLLALLCGCTSAAPQMTTEAPETQPTETQPAKPAALTMHEQAELIWNLRSEWLLEDYLDFEPYYYTFTDLDHNGRMEAFAAVTQGTGIFTNGKLWEVNEDYSGLTVYTPEEALDLPEVILERVPCYSDPGSGEYFYAFSNITRNGAAESWTTLEWVSLAQGALQVEALAWVQRSVDWESGRETAAYSSPSGQITKEEYEAAYDTAGTGMKFSMVSLDWKTADQIVSADDILQSWQLFDGERKPLRPEKMTLEFPLEGMWEPVPAKLHRGKTYSLYVPTEDWEYRTGQLAGETAEIWQSVYNPEVYLQVVTLNGMAPVQALAWVRQQYPDYTFASESLAEIWGGDSTGRLQMAARIERTENAAIVLTTHYPMEAAEGFGVRMSIMADTFRAE